ncbi:MAG: hypothetical protein JXB38_08625, partial [Anaerolineales bacterium]|nr:hypothetical protein [Anaerolineales bacterium]
MGSLQLPLARYCLTVLGFLLLGLALTPAQPALAGGSNDPECPFEDAADCAAWYAAQNYGVTPTTTPVPGAQPPVTTVTKNIINLGSQSLVRAYQGVLDAMVAGSIGHLETELRPGFRFGFSTILQYSSQGLSGVGFFGNNLEAITYVIWKKVLAVAGAFFPLLIVANIAQVYTSG